MATSKQDPDRIVSAAAVDDDASFELKLRPRRLQEFIGQAKVKENLAVAIEAANSGVTCNAICPGWVLTPLVQQQIDARAKSTGKSVRDAEIALLSEKQPMHQFTKPENIGALAVFLASDAASSITGSAYSIDGGWVAQ